MVVGDFHLRLRKSLTFNQAKEGSREKAELERALSLRDKRGVYHRSNSELTSKSQRATKLVIQNNRVLVFPGATHNICKKNSCHMKRMSKFGIQ